MKTKSLRRPGGFFSRKPPPWTPRKSFLLRKKQMTRPKKSPLFDKLVLNTPRGIPSPGAPLPSVAQENINQPLKRSINING
jgi:hypothetical protein